jgi:hypothetical protein
MFEILVALFYFMVYLHIMMLSLSGYNTASTDKMISEE